MRHSLCSGVDVADNSKLLLFGGAAVAVWWFYFRTPAVPAATAAPGAPASGVPSPVTPTAQPAGASVEAIQAGTLLAAGAPAEGLGVDAWGWYVNQQLAPLGKSAPDPAPLFAAALPGFTRSQLVTAPEYWAVMGPALKSQLGLSGLGLYRWVQ